MEILSRCRLTNLADSLGQGPYDVEATLDALKNNQLTFDLPDFSLEDCDSHNSDKSKQQALADKVVKRADKNGKRRKLETTSVTWEDS